MVGLTRRVGQVPVGRLWQAPSWTLKIVVSSEDMAVWKREVSKFSQLNASSPINDFFHFTGVRTTGDRATRKFLHLIWCELLLIEINNQKKSITIITTIVVYGPESRLNDWCETFMRNRHFPCGSRAYVVVIEGNSRFNANICLSYLNNIQTKNEHDVCWWKFEGIWRQTIVNWKIRIVGDTDWGIPATKKKPFLFFCLARFSMIRLRELHTQN